jgi:predicted short-subunit dehydrogenase-like oxidoreductase (DUF2520 family)
MITVCFLGFGSVNYNLCNALHNTSEVTVNQIYNRSKITIPPSLSSIPYITDLEKIEAVDVYIIGIPDDAIEGFSAGLPFTNQLVVHTSGGVAMKVLSSKNRRGVLYPLQTFSRNKILNLQKVPVCIEAEAKTDLQMLQKLGKSISENVVKITSEERAKLHLAAVFVNNFVNYLYTVSEDILKKEKLDFDLLKPLILETAAKIQNMSPNEAQTGPAKRKDTKTIEKHLHLLSESPFKELYKILNNAIQNSYGKKL